MRQISFTKLLLLLAIALVSACKNDYLNYNKVPENIKTGTAIDVTTKTIGSGGGTITVSMPGTPVDGLEVVVPDSAYSSSETFTITYSEIISHEFGTNFNPISPMITIKCDGGYSDKLMNITVPVAIPAGHIPIGFMVDKSTGKLEGIPVESVTSNSITLSTRHFLSGNMLRAEASALKSGMGLINTGANIIITSLAESMLKGLTSISSGYKPGTDDWEFVNRGSFIAPGGHCAGQTFTSMWYYYEMKAAEGDLFEKFSNLAGYDKDNARGYRFSSVVQEDLDFGGTLNDFLWANVDLNPETDKLKMYTIAGAMLVTGEPQAIGIYRIKGHKANGKPIYGGHALVCYAASISGGKLSIADPNKPGLVQEIDYVNDKFQPYVAMANAEAASDPYPFITYSAKTALIEWDKIGQRYGELLNFTVGTVGANKFPEYTIMVKGKVDKELTDNFSIDSDTLRTEVELPDAYMYFNVNGKKLVRHVMVNEKGQTINTWDNVGSYTILKPGLNVIGFDIYAKKEGAVDKAGNLRNLFVDFKWYNIYYSKLRISPNPIAAEPGKDVEITANTDGTAPKNAKYVWNFGDGSKEVTLQNDSTVVHKFSKKGEYTVTVTLIDNSNAKEMGKATAEATIQDGSLGELQKCRYVHLIFNADMDCGSQTAVCFSGIDIANEPVDNPSVNIELKWVGTKFSSDYSYWFIAADGDKVSYEGTIAGEVSANGLKVISFNGNETSKSNGGKDIKTRAIKVTDVPYDPTYQYNEYSPRFSVEGTQVQTHIVSASSSASFVSSDGSPWSISLIGINYNDPEDEPYLWVTFFGKR